MEEKRKGLHGKDIGNLIKILRKLADAGNCVCVVEHDENVIKAADKIIEIGPKPGARGGRVIFEGDTKSLLKSKDSLTGKWLFDQETNQFAAYTLGLWIPIFDKNHEICMLLQYIRSYLLKIIINIV